MPFFSSIKQFVKATLDSIQGDLDAFGNGDFGEDGFDEISVFSGSTTTILAMTAKNPPQSDDESDDSTATTPATVKEDHHQMPPPLDKATLKNGSLSPTAYLSA